MMRSFSDLLLLIENAILHVKVCVESDDKDLESLKSQSEYLRLMKL